MRLIITEQQRKKIVDSLIGEKVMVYYNLHKHTFSITIRGIVMAHVDYVKLKNVEFRVRTGGKETVRTKKQKNVHAFVIGTLLDYCEYPCENLPEEPIGDVVTYNPYKHDSFVIKSTEQPVFNANLVEMINSKNKIFIVEN
jgi:hypothetical protein